MKDNSRQINILNDPDETPRSYLINGWNDYFAEIFNVKSMDMGRIRDKSIPTAGIPQPTQTIVYGEMRNGEDHFYMDFLEGRGNDIDVIHRGRHTSKKNPNSARDAQTPNGGSVYTFADGHLQVPDLPGFGIPLVGFEHAANAHH